MEICVMGYYFPQAKTVADLSPEQKKRYESLRSEGAELPFVLKNRLGSIEERIGPITSGEILSAFEELWQDAVVCWVLSGENPDIEWIDLEYAKDGRTDEERQRDREMWKGLVRFNDEQKKREQREWEKENPIRHLIRKFLNRFRRLT